MCPDVWGPFADAIWLLKLSTRRCSLQSRLAGVEQKIASLEAAFEEATAKKAALAAQVGCA